MRANQKFTNDDSGQVGIGTMIVFIATILVAAVAAGVLIDTSGKLQERSSRTGDEATEKVSGNLEVTSLVGNRTTTSQNVRGLDLYLSVAPGAPSMDLAQLQIQFKTPTQHKAFKYLNGAASATEFSASAIRDPDTSFTGASPVVNAGDLVKVTINTYLCGCQLVVRTEYALTLIPEIGNSVVAGFATPASYGIATRVTLI